MKPGDMAEIAIWLSGEETPEQIERWKATECDAVMRAAERQYHVEIGPLAFAIKSPGDERVPPVPDHIHGPDVRLLIGEAKVISGRTAVVPAPGFVHDLTGDDLAKLRRITRQAHSRRCHGDRLTDAQCDGIIEALGPDTAVKTLRDGSALN